MYIPNHIIAYTSTVSTLFVAFSDQVVSTASQSSTVPTCVDAARPRPHCAQTELQTKKAGVSWGTIPNCQPVYRNRTLRILAFRSGRSTFRCCPSLDRPKLSWVHCLLPSISHLYNRRPLCSVSSLAAHAAHSPLLLTQLCSTYSLTWSVF